MKRWLSVLLVIVLLCAMTACEKEKPKPTIDDIKLTIPTSGFNNVFSPFYAELPTDQTIAELTQLKLITTDRMGYVVYNGIDGETREYNGTAYTYTGPADLMVTTHDDGVVDYDFTLRSDLVFSDETPLTADDAIFTMYVLCDPTYDGPSSFASLPIMGLKDYRTGMVPKWRLILADTPKTAVTGSPDGYYTDEEAVEFWTIFNTVGAEFAQGIVDIRKEAGWGDTVSEIAARMGYTDLLPTATAMDLFTAMVERYTYDISDRGLDSEKVGASFEDLLLSRLTPVLQCGVATTSSAPTITGIQKTDTYSFRVTLERADARALTELAFAITPLHYYGDVKSYDYENAMFGFTKGDLSSVKKRSSPLGAGPYTYFRVHDGVITMRANAKYYNGVPAIERLSFLKTDESNLVNRLGAGTIRIAEQALDLKKITEIETVNGGVLNGDILNVRSSERMTYGYIGMSADGVSVGNDASSQQSKALRRALATVFAYYRDMAITEYCGTYATVTDEITRSDSVEYAPNTHDNDIPPTESAMLDAVRECLRIAGYTVSGGQVTASPVGGKQTFQVYLLGNEQGRNPAYPLMLNAKKVLEQLGITLIIHDYSYENELWDAVRNGRAQIWCGTWQDGHNPDTYSVYHSNGGLQYMFDINDAELNDCIMAARQAKTDAQRAEQYERCFEIVKDWTVEIPLYQQKNALVYRVDSVEADTITPDVTPYYTWMRDIALTKLKNK